MDYEAEDRYASRMARAALDSAESWTILDVCSATGFPPPRSDDDCVAFARMCGNWGIKHNCMSEPFYLKCLAKARGE